MHVSVALFHRAHAAIGLLALTAMLPSPAVHAATSSTSFNVTATVQTACSVSAADLAFGNYDAASVSDTVASTTITVTCSLLTPYDISLDSGANANGSVRRLGSGASRLNYEIYRNALMTNIFGTVAATLGVSGVGTGLAVPTTIYGKIPKGQAVAPGSYTDQITVTVDY